MLGPSGRLASWWTSPVENEVLYLPMIYPLFPLGNGEIDFDEFLTLMTSTERYLEDLRGKCTASKTNNTLLHHIIYLVCDPLCRGNQRWTERECALLSSDQVHEEVGTLFTLWNWEVADIQLLWSWSPQVAIIGADLILWASHHQHPFPIWHWLYGGARGELVENKAQWWIQEGFHGFHGTPLSQESTADCVVR